MQRRWLPARAMLFACGWWLASTGALTAQSVVSLSLDSIATTTTNDRSLAEFQFSAETAGFLTVVVRGDGATDLATDVMDDLGQLLPEGQTDRDLGGNQGAEQLAVTVPHAGDYRIRVRAWSGAGQFQIGSSWITFPDAGRLPDPDGKPTGATPLPMRTQVDDSLAPSTGDPWDWFVVTSETGGVVTVITEAPEGDLVIEVFREGDYGSSTGLSDQDMDGVAGNESLTGRIEAGGRSYFKVSSLFGSESNIPYSIRAGVI